MTDLELIVIFEMLNKQADGALDDWLRRQPADPEHEPWVDPANHPPAWAQPGGFNRVAIRT